MPRDNRQALLSGARACLDEQGYARTRARDVADAAGVSLAAIGYHFGSVDTLLVEALLHGMQEWAQALDEALGAVDPTSQDALAQRWDVVLGSFEGYRGVLAASYELIARADAVPDVAARLGEVVETARRGVAADILGIDEQKDPERAARAGVAGYAVMSGLIVQWLVSPSALPTGDELVAGLRDAAGVRGRGVSPRADSP